jgi:opine dehydrogenase
MQKYPKITILGGGHAAFAHAADLSLKGFEVRLFELPEMAATLAPVRARGGIEAKPAPSTGLPGGLGCPQLITTDAQAALEGADVIFMVVPAFAQNAFSRAIAPYIKPTQIVALSPANFGGAVTLAATLRAQGCETLPVIVEAQSMMYACRKDGPASVRIFGFKHGLRLAVFPAQLTGQTLPVIQQIFPAVQPVPNILWTWLSSSNAVAHPPVAILNAGRIENTGGDFLFYVDGVTPAVRRVMTAVDAERLAIGAALGLDLIPDAEMVKIWYGHQGFVDETYPDEARNPIYAAIKAEPALDSRYLTEDVPYGLVPLEDMGRRVGVVTSVISALIDLSNVMLGRDFRAEGQTLDTIGLGGLTMDALKQLAETGKA